MIINYRFVCIFLLITYINKSHFAYKFIAYSLLPFCKRISSPIYNGCQRKSYLKNFLIIFDGVIFYLGTALSPKIIDCFITIPTYQSVESRKFIDVKI